MLKQYLAIFAFIATGAVAGALYAWFRTDSGGLPEGTPAEPARFSHEMPGSADRYPDDARVRALEAEVAALKARITALESSSPEAAQQPAVEPDTDAPLYEVSEDPISMTEGLIAAGLDAYSAEQIARRQSAVELRRLELRDNAIREGTIGNDDYRDQLMALREEEVKLRNEVAPDIYDRYLYHTGQPNRVAVQSVMMGSSADNAGVQAGDMILSYNGATVYNYRDLRAMTLEGEPTDYVNLRLLRDDSEMNITVARGPLGVRLDSVRINPDS